jgi:hypothetical protein
MPSWFRARPPSGFVDEDLQGIWIHFSQLSRSAQALNLLELEA